MTDCISVDGNEDLLTSLGLIRVNIDSGNILGAVSCVTTSLVCGSGLENRNPRTAKLEVTIVPRAEVADCGGLPWSGESNTGKGEDKGSDKGQTSHSEEEGSNLRLMYLGGLA